MDSMDEEQENMNSTIDRDPVLDEWGVGDIVNVNAGEICMG